MSPLVGDFLVVAILLAFGVVYAVVEPRAKRFVDARTGNFLAWRLRIELAVLRRSPWRNPYRNLPRPR